MKREMCSIYLKIKNLIKSMGQFNEIHLMDQVIYNNQKCFINNGTMYDEKGVHLWEVCPEKINSDGKRSTFYAKSDELKRVFSWFNIKNALFSYYEWWNQYWYQIELRRMMIK